MQKTLYRSSGMSRSVSFLIEAPALTAYGFVVNAPHWDFGKLLGAYVVLFFLLAQFVLGNGSVRCRGVACVPRRRSDRCWWRGYCDQWQIVEL
jgi:hypothetical protein